MRQVGAGAVVGVHSLNRVTVDAALRDKERRALEGGGGAVGAEGRDAALAEGVGDSGDDADSSLDIARTVSTAVVEVVQQVLARRAPRFVVAKGGITSHDVAVAGLGIVRAEVVGQLLPGAVSVLRPLECPQEVVGVPYVVFAGNVGDDASLVTAVTALRGKA